jgi:phage tail-like protein
VSSDWYQWWDEARRPRARNIARTVHVILLDRFQADVNGWTFLEAVPTSYSVSPLNALVSTPLIETLELSVRGFDAEFDLSPRTD